MKKILYALSFLLFTAHIGWAQYDCSSNRFRDLGFFNTWDATTAVSFGSGPAVGSGQTQELKMDIYEPQGDTMSKRPLILVAFGGSFVTGNREQVADLCQVFAKLGYVAATIDYRVGFFFPSQVTTTLAVMRGMHDMKAAIRYFYKDAQTTNTYRIDTNYVFVSGVSAGAITALHAAYFDKDVEVPAYMVSDTAGLGGVEGNSGNPGYSSDVAGVVSFSGTIGDSAWIESGDVPVISFHDVGDDVVPFQTAQVSVGGFPTGLEADGSQSIHIRANNLQIPNRLKIFPTNSHVGYLQGSEGDYNLTLDMAKNFVADVLCGDITFEPSDVTLSIDFLELGQDIEVYPNPVSDILNVQIEKDLGQLEYQVVDIAGRLVYSVQSNNLTQQLQIEGIQSGLYFLRILKENQMIYSQKVLVQ